MVTAAVQRDVDGVSKGSHFRSRVFGPPELSGATDESIADLAAIAERCAALPELIARSAEKLIGYDEAGLPV